MWRTRFRTEFLVWSLLIVCSSFGQVISQQRPPPPPSAQPQPFLQNPALIQQPPQLGLVQPRLQNDPQAAVVPTALSPAGTPIAMTPTSTPVIAPIQFQGAQPQLDAFMPQLDPFIPKPVLFQLSTNIFNSAGMRVSHFSRFQIWYVTSQILKSVDDRLKPDYITMLQPQLVKGIPSQNLTQALSQAHHPEILKTLVEQSTGMLPSQQAIVVQKIRGRLAEPAVIRMIMTSENPAELFAYFSPPLLTRNMPSIIKAIGELPETLLTGTNIQAKLLPRVTLSTWLASVRKSAKVDRWSADDLMGKSFLGSSNHLDLALLGLGCNDLALLAETDVLVILGRFRHDLYELRKRAGLQLPFPLNIRNCAMERVLEYLKAKNGTATDANILSGLRNAEIDLIGGEILSGIPASALDNVPAETRQAILEEIGQVDSTDLFSLLATPTWFGNKLYNDLINSSQSQSQGQMLPPMPGLPGSSPLPVPMAPPSNLQIPLKMGSLLFYSSDFLTGNWSKEVVTEILITRTGSYCLPKRLRMQWAQLLLATFGPVLAWSPNDLASVGDLLIVLPPTELNSLPVETLARSVTTILRQSDFHSSVGSASFVRKCVDSLDDGQQFYMSYKLLMRKLLQATQLMVNSVRTIDEIVLNELARGPSRVARSVDVDEGRVRRQASAAIAAFMASTNSNANSETSTAAAPVVAPTPAAAATQAFMAPPMVAGFIFQAPQATVTATQQQQPLRVQQFPPPRDAIPPPLRFAPRPPPQQQQQIFVQQAPQAQAPSTTTPAATASTPLVSRATTTGPQVTQVPEGTQLSAPQAAAQGQGQAQAQAPLQQPQPVQTPSAPAPAPATVTTSQQVPPSAAQTGVALTGRAAGSAPAPQQTASAPPQNIATGMLAAPSTATQAQAAGPQQPQTTAQAQASPTQAQSFDTRALRPNQQQPFPQQTLMGLQQPPQQGGKPFVGPPGLVPPPPQQQERPPFPGQQQQQQPVVPRPLNQSETSSGTSAVTGDNSTKTDDEARALPPPPGVIRMMVTNMTNVNTTTAVQANVNGTSAAADDLQARSLDSGALLPQSNKTTTPTGFDMPKDSVEVPITCRGMKAAGPAAIGMTVSDFQALSTEDLFDCVEPIGLIDWDLETKQALLALMAEKLHLSPEGINTLSLIELGGLVSAFGVADNTDGSSWLSTPGNSTGLFDISDIDLTLPDSLDGLAILGSQIKDPEVLKILADKFTLQNQITGKVRGAISRPDNLRVVIWSLGNVLCGMDEKIVAGIFDADRSLFIDVSPMVGRVVGCSSGMLQTLAEAAVLPSNYGDPSAWTEQDVEVIGVVVAGLSPSQLASIQPASFAGLTPLAVQQFSTTAFQSLSPSQVGRMPYESALAIQSHHVQVLSQEQMNALNTVISVQSEDFNVPEVQIRGAGDRDDDLGDGSDLEMTRSLDDTESASGRKKNSTAGGGRGKKGNGTTTDSEGEDGGPLEGLEGDGDDELVIEIVDDDGSTNANTSGTAPKSNRTRRPMKDKETSPSRPSAAAFTPRHASAFSLSVSLLFVHALQSLLLRWL